MDIEQLAGMKLGNYEIESLLGRGVIEVWLPDKNAYYVPGLRNFFILWLYRFLTKLYFSDLMCSAF